MPAIVTVNVSDDFTGAAADLQGRVITPGHLWVRTSLSRNGTINTTGAGTARLVAGPSTVQSAALYDISITSGPGFEFTSSQSQRQFFRMQMGTLSGIARAWTVAGVGLFALSEVSGLGAGFQSLNFPASNTLLWTPNIMNVHESAYDVEATGFRTLVGDMSAVSSSDEVTVRTDEYGAVIKHLIGGVPIYTFRPAPLAPVQNSTNSVAGVSEAFRWGLLAVDTFTDALTPEITKFTYGYYDTFPTRLHPNWVEWGSTAVITLTELDYGLGVGGSVGEISGSAEKLGGFDVVIPKLHGDRAIQPKMLQVDNRLNPAVVDVKIGPFTWRASAFSEAEVPLSEALNIDLISLRGGGARSTVRIFADTIPKTFRQ